MIDPKVKLMAVVKSNAYGHSLVHFAHEIVELALITLAWIQLWRPSACVRRRLNPDFSFRLHSSGKFWRAVEAELKSPSLVFESLEFLLKNKKVLIIKIKNPS